MSSKREEWAKRIRSWERSGQTRAGFCRSRGLNLHSFDYWRRALRPSGSTALVPVVVKAPATLPGSSVLIEIVLPDGVRVRAPLEGDAIRVAALISALRAC